MTRLNGSHLRRLGKFRACHENLTRPISSNHKSLKNQINSADKMVESPISLLNEMHPGLEYSLIEKSGPPHAPRFKICVTVNGKQFEGVGSSLKLAKYKAAEIALKFLIPCSNHIIKRQKENNRGNLVSRNVLSKLNELYPGLEYKLVERLGPPHNPVFKISVEIDGQKFEGNGKSLKFAKNKAAEAVLEALNQLSDDAFLVIENNVNNNLRKNPIASLNELFPGLVYKLIKRSGPPHASTFQISVTVNGHMFNGTGSSIKLAKSKAAENALKSAELLVNNPISKTSKKSNDIFMKMNPVSLLNQIYPGLRYNINRKSGPAHAPVFEACVDVVGQQFKGAANSKQLAKFSVAEKAIEYLRNESGDANCANDDAQCTQTKRTNENGQIFENTDNSIKHSKSEPVLLKAEEICLDKSCSEITNNADARFTKKNPVALLNELYPGLRYDINKKSGPPHAPVFEACVEVVGQQFSGVANSKQLAKKTVAEEAIHFLKGSQTDNGQNEEANSTDEQFAKNKDVITNIETEKNPVSILNEKYPGLKYIEAGRRGPPHAPEFKMCIEVNGENYIGTGTSKQSAKYNAAKKALDYIIEDPDNYVDKSLMFREPVEMLNEVFPYVKYIYGERDIGLNFNVTAEVDGEKFEGVGPSLKSAKAAASKDALSKLLKRPIYASKEAPENITYLEQMKGNQLARLVSDKFASLMANDATHAIRRVLAGVVKVQHDNVANAEVIAVTTGSKSISGGCISLDGLAVNDSHAEILARRCMMYYFYDQLELLLTSETIDSSIFKSKIGGKGYELKEGIDFYLYINTAPCGDARVFGVNDAKLTNENNNSTRGFLRTKLESGEGTIPIKESLIQTWDGVILGERLLTMSCSDKICKWNVVGIQGALLSQFIDPVYLKGIILGAIYNKTNLTRAIYGRIETVLKDLPSSFHLNKPLPYSVSSPEIRCPTKSTNFAVNWITGAGPTEFLNCQTGRIENGIGISRLCKKSLVIRYLRLSNDLIRLDDLDEKPLTVYSELKESASSYMVTKKILYEVFKNSDMGTWVGKPIEQDMFTVTEGNRKNEDIKKENMFNFNFDTYSV